MELRLSGWVSYMLSLSRHKPSDKGEKGEERLQVTSPKAQKTQSKYCILIADQTPGYIYVENLGGYVPVNTIGENGDRRYFSIEHGSPIVPDPDTISIDDGAFYSSLLANNLRLMGYNVAIAKDAKGAISSLGIVDLVIMGTNLKSDSMSQPSNETASQFLEQVIEYSPSPHIILSTIPDNIEPSTKSLSALVNQGFLVIQKPYEFPKGGDLTKQNKLLAAIRMELGIPPLQFEGKRSYK